MSKKVLKSIGYLFLVILFSVNITSTSKIQFGGERVEARTLIPCHSSGVFHLGYQYTACSTCSLTKRHRGEDEGQCDNGLPGEN